ncbi:hypothetical protein [Methanobrevibacter sp.]|uniref:hypothetical protein n=1 Tax=Methanobrevibacter sp. TaxID=66852 RepID=UPI0025DACEA7|nr:hypothetical protein [Methanobrevibacter sp.]MBQ2962622.1 hypothetical protein [Methanobrevibacter sp.]
MKRTNKLILLIAIVIAILTLLIAASEMGLLSDSDDYNVDLAELTDELTIDMSNWSYDEENNIYYQLGLPYCTDPESTEYESLAIYVPGEYFKSEENSNGTYTCTVINGNVGNYSASNAPIVMPIDTPGYSAHKAPTKYDAKDVKDYTDVGFIYVDAGCRGRENGNDYSGGAPWGVTDLKAAVLYLRFNDDTLPGDCDRIFSFGHSGGGAQSAILGASGGSELYTPYLESIGAALVNRNGNKLSDSICGAMCWCPITSLDTADEAYEWTMGQYSTQGTRGNGTWTGALSDDLAVEYAQYINDLGLRSPNGKPLSLSESDEGIYTNGSFYNYMLKVVETSLNNFLNDTSFPYTPSSSGGMGMDSLPEGVSLSSDVLEDSSGRTYRTPQDYIDSLNGDEEWIIYNSSTNTAKVTSIEAFVNHCKSPSKDVGAFDDLGRDQAENELFGTDESESLHFDSIMANVLKENSEKYSQYSDYDSSKVNAYAKDLNKRDKLNKSIEYRSNMYNPLYYISGHYDGIGSSHPAKYWRINSGIEQEDTSFTVETNLALALIQDGDVKSVEFNEVWGQGHVQAERKGSAEGNFINWVNECLSKESEFFLFNLFK